MEPIPHIKNILSDFNAICEENGYFLKLDLRSEEENIHTVKIRWDCVNSTARSREFMFLRITCRNEEIDIQEIGRRGFVKAVTYILDTLADCYANPNRLD